MNLKQNADGTLKGHSLLLLSPWTPPAEWLDKVRDEYPKLEINYRVVEFGAKTMESVSSEDWSRVTILLTGSFLPTRERAPRLEYVQLLSAGANQILKNPLFLDTDITFCTANGVHGPQISEWVICTFLASQHRIPSYLELQHQAKWRRRPDHIDDAVGQRVGILGYGSIGRQVARVAKALGMDVFAYTLHPRETPESRRDDGFSPPGLGDPEGTLPSRWFSGTTKEALHEFLGSGLDLLVVATPLTDKTHHLISAPEFEVLAKKKAFISNIGRGPIVHTDHLIDALDREVIRGAALDVTDPEPLPDGHPLWHAKNVIITPHVSGGSTKYLDRVLAILEGNLGRLSEGRELANRVSRREGY